MISRAKDPSEWYWIPIEEKMPKSNRKVWIINMNCLPTSPLKTLYKGAGEFELDTAAFSSRIQVKATHWIPLPDPPGMKKNAFEEEEE